MYNSNINLVTLTILLVNVFDNCYGYFEEKGYTTCYNQINRVFRLTQNRPYAKNYASFAFLNLREDDTCFKRENNPTLLEGDKSDSLEFFNQTTLPYNQTNLQFAILYYREIFNNRIMEPAPRMKTPADYCSDRKNEHIEAYFDTNEQKHITNAVEACLAQIKAVQIPSVDQEMRQQVLDWIYEHIVVKTLDNVQHKYVIDYIMHCDKYFYAPKTKSPDRFCKELHTHEDYVSTSFQLP